MGITPSNSTFAFAWKLLGLCFFRRDVVLLVVFLSALESWTHYPGLRIVSVSAAEGIIWKKVYGSSAVFAIQGMREYMEDRYVIDENVEKSGISLIAVFDGHGGQLSVNFAKHTLIPNLCKKLVEASNIVRANSLATVSSANNDISKTNKVAETAGGKDKSSTSAPRVQSSAESGGSKDKPSASSAREQSGFKKPQSSPNAYTIPKAVEISKRLWNLLIDTLTNMIYSYASEPQRHEAKYYVDSENNIDVDILITDEVLAADKELLKILLERKNISGSTALIAVLDGTKLTVANVGDSRGVMCDSEGNTIPLSYDHKPDVEKEWERILKAGGVVTFEDVPRVNNWLAMSRALGDILVKDNNKVIAEPGMLLFDLAEYKPKFLILATDGLWDVFSNEEAVEFIEKHLHEADFGAMSLTLAAYHRFSEDNITVIVVAFKNGKYQIN